MWLKMSSFFMTPLIHVAQGSQGLFELRIHLDLHRVRLPGQPTLFELVKRLDQLHRYPVGMGRIEVPPLGRIAAVIVELSSAIRPFDELPVAEDRGPQGSLSLLPVDPVGKQRASPSSLHHI